MKIVTTIGLVFCFYLFLGLVLATQGQAEDHYIYKDPRGLLVISNKPPPSGSNVLRKLDLTEGLVQQPQQAGDSQPSGRSDGSAKQSK